MGGASAGARLHTGLAGPPACARARRSTAGGGRAAGGGRSRRPAAHDEGAQAELAGVLSWASERGLEASGVTVDHGPRGRGLFASRRLEAGATVLSVPLGACALVDHGPSGGAVDAAAWPIRLAAALLRERAAGPASELAPYVRALPRTVGASPLAAERTAAELAELHYAPLERAAGRLRASVGEWHAHLDPEEVGGATRGELLDAVAVVHSRVFKLRGAAGGPTTHLLCPLAELHNHGGGARANVGWALADRGDGAGARLELAPTRDLEAGEEALLDYGAAVHGADHFLMCYGFVPPAEEMTDAAELFADAAHAAAWLGAPADAADAFAAPQGTDPSLGVGAGGAPDARLLALCEAALGGDAGAARAAIARRAEELLLAAPTDIAADLADLAAAEEGGGRRTPWQDAALRFRAGKKALLHEAACAAAVV